MGYSTEHRLHQPERGAQSMRTFSVSIVLIFAAPLLAQTSKPSPSVKDLVLALDAERYDKRVDAALQLRWIGAEAASAMPALMKRATSDNSEEVRTAAIEAIKAISPDRLEELVPTLTKQLQEEPQLARATLGRMGPVATPAWIVALKHGQDHQREDAAIVLAKLGKQAASAVTALVEAATSDDRDRVRVAAVRALAEIAPDSLAEVVDSLEKQVLSQDRQAGLGFATLQAVGPKSVPVLVKAFEVGNSWTQQEACAALGEIDPLNDAVVHALIKALRAEDEQVRKAAASALGDIGPVTDDVIPALVEATGAVPNSYAFHMRVDQVKPALLKALVKGSPTIRKSAAHTLWMFPEVVRQPEVTRALLEAMKDPVDDVSGSAAYALQHVGSNEVILALLKLSESDNDHRATSAVSSLAFIQPEAGQMLMPPLLEALKSQKPQVRNAAAAVIPTLGPVALQARDLLVKGLADDKTWSYCVGALAKVDPGNENLVASLLAAINGDAERKQRRAMELAAAIGPHGKALSPSLLKLLDEEIDDSWNQGLVYKALVSISVPRKDIVIKLSEIARSKRKDREDATAALGSLGVDGLEALVGLLAADEYWVAQKAADRLWMATGTSVPLLQGQGLKHKNAAVRAKSAELLGRIGEPSLPAISALTEALGDDNADVRKAAASALSELAPKARGNIELRKAYPVLLKRAIEGSISIRGQVALWGAAVAALEAAIPGDETVVPALIEKLKSDDARTRVVALRLLSTVGPRAKSAEAAVVATLDRRAIDDSERLTALSTLATIAPESERLVPALLAALQHGDARDRKHVLGLLGDLGPLAKTAGPALRALLKDVRKSDALSIARALVRIFPEDTALRDQLIDRGRQQMKALYKDWHVILRQVGPALIPDYLELARKEMADRPMETARNIAALGADAVPALRIAIKGRHYQDRWIAMAALEALQSKASEAVPEVLIVLKNDPHAANRAYAVSVLRVISQPGDLPTITHALVAALEKDPDPEVRAGAAEALGYLATPTPEITATLRAAQRDPYRAVRTAALRTLEDFARPRNGAADIPTTGSASEPSAPNNAASGVN